MPRTRIPIFEARMTVLCEEAGLPLYDDTHYALLEDTLLFIWHDPEFCIAAPLAHASAYGMTADLLLGAWEHKFGAGQARRQASG